MPALFYYKFDNGNSVWYLISRHRKERWKRNLYKCIIHALCTDGKGPLHESNHPPCMWLKDFDRLEIVSALEVLAITGRSVGKLIEEMIR